MITSRSAHHCPGSKQLRVRTAAALHSSHPYAQHNVGARGRPAPTVITHLNAHRFLRHLQATFHSNDATVCRCLHHHHDKRGTQGGKGTKKCTQLHHTRALRTAPTQGAARRPLLGAPPPGNPHFLGAPYLFWYLIRNSLLRLIPTSLCLTHPGQETRDQVLRPVQAGRSKPCSVVQAPVQHLAIGALNYLNGSN